MKKCLIVEKLEQLAARFHLDCRRHKSVEGLDEIYLYSDRAKDPRHRYAFARWWRADGPFVLWVMLNPAKGDTERRRRPTLDRCIAESKSKRAGGVIIANLLAARHNKPRDLFVDSEPIGPHNDAVLRDLSALANSTFVAWGAAHGTFKRRVEEVVPFLNQPLLCLGVNKDGSPKHPLYAKKIDPVQWPVTVQNDVTVR